MCAVKAAAAGGVQVIFRRVGSAAVAASKDSVFAEDKLPGQVQILFQTILFAIPAIRFLEVQYFTQYIITFYIHLKLYYSVRFFYIYIFYKYKWSCRRVGLQTGKKALILKDFACYEGSFLSVSSNIRNVFKHLLFIMVQTGNYYLKVQILKFTFSFT